jgi:hypothetical protein
MEMYATINATKKNDKPRLVYKVLRQHSDGRLLTPMFEKIGEHLEYKFDDIYTQPLMVNGDKSVPEDLPQVDPPLLHVVTSGFTAFSKLSHAFMFAADHNDVAFAGHHHVVALCSIPADQVYMEGYYAHYHYPKRILLNGIVTPSLIVHDIMRELPIRYT